MQDEILSSYHYDNDSSEGLDQRSSTDHRDSIEHPCLALKKLLGGGTFYYSADFDLTNRLQRRYFHRMAKPRSANQGAIDSRKNPRLT